MEKYEVIKKELKNLNMIELNGISERIINKLIKEKIKKKNSSNIILTISLISIGVVIFTLLGKKIWKR